MAMINVEVQRTIRRPVAVVSRQFGDIQHHGGLSPAWPITYDELEPFYGEAEELYVVHGADGEDPTDGPRSTPYPNAPVKHE